MRQSPYKTLILWAALIVMFLALWKFLAQNGHEQKDLPFSEFAAKVDAGDYSAA